VGMRTRVWGKGGSGSALSSASSSSFGFGSFAVHGQMMRRDWGVHEELTRCHVDSAEDIMPI
jgi:hypothetical protein